VVRRSPLIWLTIICVLLLLIFPTHITIIFSIFIAFLWLLHFAVLDTSNKIRINRSVDISYVFMEEHIGVHLKIKNDSRFPIFLLEITDRANTEGAIFVAENMEVITTLKPKEEIVLNYEMEFRKRGIYQLKDISITISEPFGITRKTRVIEIPLRIVVYPERIPILELPLPLRELLPTLRTDYRLLEDLNYVDGIREYTPYDSARRIHWKASAHVGDLLVKKYEYTAATDVHLFLDLNLSKEIYAKKVWSSIREGFEEYAIMAGASLIEYMLNNKIQMKLYIICEGEKINIIENMNFAGLMERLAGVHGTNSPKYSLESALKSAIYSFTFSSTVIVFSMYLTKSILPLLVKVKTRVSRLIVFVMPFGFRMPQYDRYHRNYDVFPPNIRELEASATLLREENIIVELIDPQDSLNEVLQSEI